MNGQTAWFGSPPAHWDAVRLKYIFREKSGPLKGDLLPGAISFGEVVQKEMLNEDTLGSYQEVHSGDFLVNPINLNYDLKSLRTALSNIDVRVSPAYIVLEADRRQHPRYLRWLLYQFDVAHMKTLGAGVRQTISFADIGGCEVRLPPRDEQERIADVLDEQTARIDALIAEKERLQATLEEWRAAELTRICFGGATSVESTGNPWIPKLPKGWRLARLKHLVAGIEQGWSPECEARLADDGEWGVLKAGASNGGVFRDTEHKALPAHLEPIPALEVRPGDVVVSRASGSADLVGSFAYVYSTQSQLMLSDKNFRLKFGVNPPLQPELLAWMCSTPALREQVRQYVSGAEGLAKNIGSGSLRELWLAVPPTETQADIVEDLHATAERLRSLQEHLILHIERLREYRSSLISAAVTGQIDRGAFNERARLAA